jgi:hypothetical protein
MNEADQGNVDLVAKEMLACAELGALASFKQFQANHPEIPTRFLTEDWDYFCTVALIGSALLHMRARIAYDPILTEDFQIALGKMLNRKLLSGWAAVNDLFGFIERQGIPDVANAIACDYLLDERKETIAAAVGMWIVWNLKKAPPSPSDNALVSALGRFMFEHYGAVVADLTYKKACGQN